MADPDRKYLAIQVVFLELLLVAVLSWTLQRSFASGTADQLPILRSVDALDLAESDLHTSTLAARIGLVEDPGRWRDDVATMRQQVADLTSGSHLGNERCRALSAGVEALAKASDEFDASNAALQATFADYDAMSERLTHGRADPNLVLAVGSLAGIVAHLSRHPTFDVAHAAGFWLDTLSTHEFQTDGTDDPVVLGRLARLLIDLLPRVDELVRRQQALTVLPQTRAIRRDLRLERERLQRRAYYFDLALYATAISVSVLLLHTAMGSRARTLKLRFRIMMEHAIARISYLFIACPPEEIDARLTDALAILAEAEGADRAYVLADDGRTNRIWLRPGVQAPADWPACRTELVRLVGRMPDHAFRWPTSHGQLPPGLAARLRDDGVVGISGTGLWRAGELAGLIGFERSSRFPPEMEQDRVSLRLAADVIASALLRRDGFHGRMELVRKLRRAERLQVLGTFASGIAHNFNNLLGVILGQAEMAAEAADVGPDAARHVHEVAVAGHRAREIAVQILRFGRADQGEPRPLEVGDVVREAARHVEAAQAGADVVVDDAAPGTRVLADRSQLNQVFVNVIQNAVQASPVGRPVSVVVDAAWGTTQTLSHGKLEGGRHVRVTVSDRGRGMTEDERAQVFEPFFTTRQDGTGLGLATAHDAIEAMDGAFDVQSAPGEGTRVSIWIPEFPEGAGTAHRGGAILLFGAGRRDVERDEDALAALGYEPVGFVELEAAIRTLEADAERYDLAIVNVAVVERHGASILDAMRERLPRRSPVLLSLPEGRDHAPCQAHPAIAGLLVRPWHAATVGMTIARTLDRWANRPHPSD